MFKSLAVAAFATLMAVSAHATPPRYYGSDAAGRLMGWVGFSIPVPDGARYPEFVCAVPPMAAQKLIRFCRADDRQNLENFVIAIAPQGMSAADAADALLKLTDIDRVVKKDGGTEKDEGPFKLFDYHLEQQGNYPGTYTPYLSFAAFESGGRVYVIGMYNSEGKIGPVAASLRELLKGVRFK